VTLLVVTSLWYCVSIELTVTVYDYRYFFRLLWVMRLYGVFYLHVLSSVQAYWKNYIFVVLFALLFVRFYYKVHACLSAADFKITCCLYGLLSCFLSYRLTARTIFT